MEDVEEEVVVVVIIGVIVVVEELDKAKWEEEEAEVEGRGLWVMQADFKE